MTWTDGSAWTLRLDQGVGYWRACNAREPFPFEQPVERQVEHCGHVRLTLKQVIPPIQRTGMLVQLEMEKVLDLPQHLHTHFFVNIKVYGYIKTALILS